jgi:hypothetical protein
MCTHFGHPTKKNELVLGSPWEAAMAGVGAPWEPMGSSPERGKRGKEEGERGAQLGVAMGRVRAVGGGTMGARPCCSFGLLCSVRERRQEGEEKKEKREREGK